MVSTVILFTGMLPVSFAEPEAAVTPADRASYEAAQQEAGRDSAAHVRLALWCEAHGLHAERMKHLALAVLSDPTNAMARGLMGLVAYRGQWKRPDGVADKVKADDELTARLADYNGRRARTRETADAQWELGLWCEKNGLDSEALAHFTAVTRLDPSREAAWKRLGCKKMGGRWVSEAQLAAEKDDAEAQKKADKHWKPLLTKWRGWLEDKTRRDSADEALAEVRDPRAVGAVWSVFVAGSAGHHERAVQVLGQIDAPAGSRALAFLSVFDSSPHVRRRAAETLRRRDPREFAGMLVGLLKKPVKYEVRPVNGPGSPGVLFIAGQQANVQRMYAPPRLPSIAASPNDQIAYDINGLPVITRTTAPRTVTGWDWWHSILYNNMSLSEFARFNPTDPALAHAVADYRANASGLWSQFFQIHPNNAAMERSRPKAEAHNLGITIGEYGSTTTTYQSMTQIPVGQIMLEYQKAAVGAQQQLTRDVAMIESHNDDIKKLNDRASQVLKDVSGKDLGDDPEAWTGWWVGLKGYAYIPKPESPRPTVVQNVPLDYLPAPVPTTSTSSSHLDSSTVHMTAMPSSSMPSCFGAGTLVRTLDGSRRIESIQVGDRVLTQDIKTGGLGYHPVTVIHHNPPSPTFLVNIGGDTIVSSPFHRFWIAGSGWVMARDLKGSETLRLLDGPARVESVETGPVQPVFNLDVAEAHDFFAGRAAALVHDNTLPEIRLEPFDAVAELVTAASTP